MGLKNDISIGEQFCDIFGLDPKEVTKITIDVAPNNFVQITIGRNVYLSEMRKTMKVLEEYELVKNDTTPFITGNDNLETLK
jgi:hypothetical protein